MRRCNLGVLPPKVLGSFFGQVPPFEGGDSGVLRNVLRNRDYARS